jgi:hypothetical protein
VSFSEGYIFNRNKNASESDDSTFGLESENSCNDATLLVPVVVWYF